MAAAVESTKGMMRQEEEQQEEEVQEDRGCTPCTRHRL